MERETAYGFGQPERVIRQYVTRSLILGVFTFPLVFGACFSGRRGGEPESLEERVKAFWQARVAGDGIKAFSYEAFSKTRQGTHYSPYPRLRPGLITSYEVKKVIEAGDEATVTVTVQYTLPIPGRADHNLSVTSNEAWVRIDGQWYRKAPSAEAELV